MIRWRQGLAVGLALVLGGGLLLANPRVGQAATSISFTPSSIASLPATVTISAIGIPENTFGIVLGLVLPAGISVDTQASTELLEGASATKSPISPSGAPGTTEILLSCTYPRDAFGAPS